MDGTLRQPQRRRRLLLDLPVVAWVIIVVEFFERLAYYGAAFTLSTYCTNMLGLSESTTNVVINLLYVVAPISACIASGIADGPIGRPKVLLVYLTVYALGLTAIALSAFPFMYAHFPHGPSTASLWLCVGGVVLFGCGYGGMKVCTSPLTADAVSRAIDEDALAAKQQQQATTAGEAPCVDGEVVDTPVVWTDEEAELKKERLSFLFRMIYWSINFGSLFGIIGAPMLRTIDDRTVASGSGTAHTGYYAGFLMCAVSTSVGTLVYVVCLPWMERNPASEAFLLPRVLAGAIARRLQFAVGSIEDEAFLRRHRRELLVFASYRIAPAAPSESLGVLPQQEGVVTARTTLVETEAPNTNPNQAQGPPHDDLEAHRHSQSHGYYDAYTQHHPQPAHQPSSSTEPTERQHRICSVFSLTVVEDVRQTLSFCRAFATLPLYWLISNQFSTNLVLTANNMSIPDGIPPEALNNVNTISLLVTVFVVDKWLFPWWFGEGRRPCVESRMVVGFVLVSVAMAWCGVVQLIIDHRGTYDSNSGDYVLRPGSSYVSVMWLVGPYVMQGIASVFVDTTVLESAYVMAPTEMKSTVMALYLTASSASGFLGIAFAPLAEQSIIGIMYFVLSLLQGLVTLAFLRVGMVSAPGEALPLLSEGDTTG